MMMRGQQMEVDWRAQAELLLRLISEIHRQFDYILSRSFSRKTHQVPHWRYLPRAIDR